MQLDLIVENARLITGDPARPSASRLGVWRGVVVGVDEELDGLATRERLDARGRTVLAGFNDAHAHSVWFGQSRLDVDLEGARTAEEVHRRVRARAAERALEGRPLDASTIGAAAAAAVEGTSPGDNALASAWYRREIVGVHLKRLLSGQE